MPTTTVKVDMDLRDRLLAEARREGRTMGQLLETMLHERERAQRFTSLRQAIAATAPDDLDRWQAESDAFEATSLDGLGGA